MRIVLIEGAPPVSDMARAAFGARPITAPRRAIVEAITEMPGAFRAEDLAAAVQRRRDPHVATATIYRSVAALEASGFIERIGIREGSALYARCGTDAHHHHIVCDGCGRTAPADCPPQLTAIAPEGYTVTRHEITLYGLCPACTSKRVEG